MGTLLRAKPDIEIIGLVEDSLNEGPREGVRRQVFFPFPQMNQPVAVAFYVRTLTDSASMFATLRRKVQELDATMPIYEMKTLEDQLDETLGTERLSATITVTFGALATLLAAVGLYGVMALTVARRTKEIGLRMALGARQGALLWMVMKEGFGLLGIGLCAGNPLRLFTKPVRGVTTLRCRGRRPWDCGGCINHSNGSSRGRSSRASAARQYDRPDPSPPS